MTIPNRELDDDEVEAICEKALNGAQALMESFSDSEKRFALCGVFRALFELESTPEFRDFLQELFDECNFIASDGAAEAR